MAETKSAQRNSYNVLNGPILLVFIGIWRLVRSEDIPHIPI